MKKINKIEKNSEVTFLGLVTKKVLGYSTNGKKYLTLLLSDNTASVDAKLWDADEYVDSLKIGRIYKFIAFASDYKNNLQLKITNFSELEEKEIEWSDFIKEAPINASLEYKFILETIQKFTNSNYKKIMLEIISKYKNDFMIWPAATKFHHNIRKGLLWHTSSMLKIAKCLPKIYSTVKSIDYDLLYSGIILHDLGKIIELNINGGIYEYSLRGKLVGHISIMNAELNKIADKLKIDDDSVVLLEHLILSSHGKMEFGSPVLPRLMEAEILWLLDNLDARIFSINDELIYTNNHSFTNRIIPLEQRIFYKHKIEKK